jgi:hypothetical protein
MGLNFLSKLIRLFIEISRQLIIKSKFYNLFLPVLGFVILTSCESEQMVNPTSHIVKNFPPVINDLIMQDSIVAGGTSTRIYCLATDLDNDYLKYQWSTDGGRIDGSGPVVKWVAPTSSKYYLLRCKVTDGKGGSASDSLRLLVSSLQNLPPIIRGMFTSKDTISVGETTTIICDAYDPDGSPLGYTWILNSPGELVYAIKNIAEYKGIVPGAHTISCYVSDNINNVFGSKIIFVK